jgi:hypothetical protein
MTPAKQRYEVIQLIAECRFKQLGAIPTGLTVAHWFHSNGIEAPEDLEAWLLEVPRDQWSSGTVH